MKVIAFTKLVSTLLILLTSIDVHLFVIVPLPVSLSFFFSPSRRVEKNCIINNLLQFLDPLVFFFCLLLSEFILDFYVHFLLFFRRSKIFFKTAGVLLDEMQDKGFHALDYKVIILDEVHERSIESDLVLVCVKQFMLKNKDLR